MWVYLSYLFVVGLVLTLYWFFGIPIPSPPSPTQPSTSEEITCQCLEEITGNPVQRNIRPPFLRNPSSGRNLELDCYDPLRKIGVEYDGVQHYKYPNPFHRTRREFEAQQKRDALKDELCRKNGIKLIRVPYSHVGRTNKRRDILQYLRNRL